MDHLDAYLRRARACHSADLTRFEPWFVDATRAGWIERGRVRDVLAAPTPFARDRAGRVVLEAGGDHGERTAALAAWVTRMAACGALPPLTGEPYAVAAAAGAEPLLQVDRAAVPFLGVAALGVHANGFVRGARGIEMWIGRRARGKRTFPGHLDNMVAGGCAAGLGVLETLRKEAHEEAGIGPELAERAVAAGRLAYTQQDGVALKVDTLACFDLELPADFAPRAVDGEMESFVRWPTLAVASSLRGADAWKPNCALVALDFLLRHGALDDDLDQDQRARLGRAIRGEP